MSPNLETQQMNHSFVTLAAVLIPISCATSSTGPPSTLSAITDRAIYAAADTITLTVRLVAGRPVALNGCPRPPAFMIQRLAGAQWQNAGSQGVRCLAIYAPSTASLEDGGSLRASVNVPAPGEYRLIVLIGPSAGQPDFTVTSNRFIVQ